MSNCFIKISFNGTTGTVDDLHYVLTNIEDILEQADPESTYEFGTVTITTNTKQIHNPNIFTNESIFRNTEL